MTRDRTRLPEPAVSSSNRSQALESPRRTPCSRAESSDPPTEQIEVFVTARSNKDACSRLTCARQADFTTWQDSCEPSSIQSNKALFTFASSPSQNGLVRAFFKQARRVT